MLGDAVYAGASDGGQIESLGGCKINSRNTFALARKSAAGGLLSLVLYAELNN